MKGFEKHRAPKFENRHIPTGADGRPIRPATSEEYELARRIRSGATWQKCRAVKLARNPICERCHEKLADEVHHIERLAVRPDLAFKLENLLALCRECHDIEDAEAGRIGKIDARNKEKGHRADEHTRTTRQKGPSNPGPLA